MKKRNLKGIIIILAITILLATPAFAEKMEWTEVGYAVKIVLNDVPDYKGHIVGTYKRQGLCLFKNGEVASYTQMGTMDADDVKGGDHDGYYELKFEDGSSFIFKIKGQEVTKEGELPRLHGTGEFIKGTGRYKGIKGTVKYDGRYYTGLKDDLTGGDAVMKVSAEYTLPESK